LASWCRARVIGHHSISSEFDTTKKISFEGTIKQVDFGNPHIYTHVETKDEATGKMVVYMVEGGSPNDLVRQGVTKESIKIGEKVKVTGNRAKNPTSMRIGQAQITKLDGTGILSPSKPRSGDGLQPGRKPGEHGPITNKAPQGDRPVALRASVLVCLRECPGLTPGAAIRSPLRG
jgi:hypothetical protein